MKIAIVGHGPSLIHAKKGDLIDSHDVVVRLKGCGASLMFPEDYGTAVHVVCMSTEVTGLAQKTIAGMYWLYPKNGQYDQAIAFDAVAKRGAPFMIPLDLCNHWNEKFRSLEPSHPNVSTGMAAIIIAAHYYDPKSITLAGFDSLMDPEVPFTRNPAIPRTGVGPSQHDWVAENKLLGMVEDFYDTKVVGINSL